MDRTSPRTFVAVAISFLAFLALAVAGPAAARAGTHFGTATVASEADTYNVVPSVASDDAGNTLISWFTAKLTVDASHNIVPTGSVSLVERRRSVGGFFEAAKPVYTSKPGDFGMNTPVSAHNDKGDVISVWGSYGSPMVNIMTGTVKDGYGGTVISRSIGDSSSGYPVVAQSEDGSAIVAWGFTQSIKGNMIRKVAYVTIDSSGHVGDVRTMPAALTAEPGDFSADINDAGDIAVSYTIAKQLFVARGTVKSGLGAQNQVEGIDSQPIVRLAGDGTAVIAGGNNAKGISLATLGRTGTVSAASPIDEPDHPSEASVTATKNDTGGILISWVRYASKNPIRYATWTPGSGMSSTTSIDVPGFVCSPVQMAVRAGAMLASWSTCDSLSTGTATYRAAAAYVPADGSATSVSVFGHLNYNTYSMPALDGDGDGIIAWHGLMGDPSKLAEGASFNSEVSTADVTIDHPVAVADPDVPPVVSGLTLKPARFKACVKKRKHCGSKLGLTVSEPSNAVISFQKLVRRKTGRKVRLVRKKAGSMTVTALASGSNRIVLKGKAGKRILKPGRYRLSVVATSVTGLKSKPVAKAFRILK